MLRLALLVALFAWWARPRVAAYARATRDARSRPMGLDEFESISRQHHAAALDAWHRFDRAHADSFVLANARGAVSPVRVLLGIREDALLAMGEIRMRLPNDLPKEIRLAATLQAMDASMLERVEDAKRRLRTFAHPGPTEQWFALRDVRPAGDFVE